MPDVTINDMSAKLPRDPGVPALQCQDPEAQYLPWGLSPGSALAAAGTVCVLHPVC